MALDPILIKPRDLPAAEEVYADDAMVTDNGLTVGRATPVQVVNAGAPVASQAEAIAGVDNAKRMTPLRTKQVLAPAILLAQAWAESPTPPDPDDPNSKSAKTWAGEAEDSAVAAEAAAATINLRAVADVPALKALDPTQWVAAQILAGPSAGIYFWTPGDQSAALAGDGTDFYVIEADDVPITSGAWLRFVIAADPAEYHQFAAREDGAVNFEVEALNGAVNRWSAMGGTPTYGGGSYPPTMKVVGPGADISGSLVAKGEGGHIFGNALGKMLEILAGVAGYITDRWVTIRPGSTGQSYASIDAQAGLDLQAGGDTVVRILDAAGAGTAHLEISAAGTDYVNVSTPSGKSLILVGSEGLGTNGLQLLHITSLSYQWGASTVGSGDTVNLAASRGVHLINPTSNPIAALTINFPAGPINGQTIRISARATVTAVTWASLGGHTIIGAPAGLAANAPVSFIYFAGYGWQRI